MNSFYNIIKGDYITADIDCSEATTFGSIAKIVIHQNNSARISIEDAVMKIRENSPQLLIIEGFNEYGEPFLHWRNLNLIINNCDNTIQILIVTTFSDKYFFEYFLHKHTQFDVFRKFLHRINWWILNKASSDKKLCFKSSIRLTLANTSGFRDYVSIEKPFVYNTKGSNTQRVWVCPATESVERDLSPDIFVKCINLKAKDTGAFIKYITDYFDQLESSSVSCDEENPGLLFGEADNDNLIYPNNSATGIHHITKSLPVNHIGIDPLKFHAIKDEFIQALHKEIGELKVAVNSTPKQTVLLIEKMTKELEDAKKRNDLDQVIRGLEQKNKNNESIISTYNERSSELLDEKNKYEAEYKLLKKQVKSMLEGCLMLRDLILEINADNDVSFIKNMLEKMIKTNVLGNFQEISPMLGEQYNPEEHELENSSDHETCALLITKVVTQGYKLEGSIIKKPQVCVEKDKRSKNNEIRN